MKGPACSAELPDTAKFCPECGEKIVRKTVCPGCGTEAAPGAKFCAECGHKFAAAPAPAPSPAPEPVSAGPDQAAVKASVDRVFALFHDKDGNCKNATKADADLVKAAAEAGDARAMFLLGEILADGCDGFVRDPKAPAGWYRKSAEAGDPWGMVSYAVILFSGDPDSGLEKDAEAGQAWIAKGGALLAARGEQTAMNYALLCSALAQAPKPDGDDGPPDLGAAAAVAGILLQAAGDVDPETASAVDRQAVGLAHFVLAMDAMTKKDFDLAHEHLEQGVAFGNKDCKEMLEELEGGGENAANDAGDDVGDDAGADAGDDVGDDAGDDTGADAGDDAGDDASSETNAAAAPETPRPTDKTVLNDGWIAQTGTCSSISLENVSWAVRNGMATFRVGRVRNDSSWNAGALKLILWFCSEPYAGGTIQGVQMAEAILSRESLRAGFQFSDVEVSGIFSGNPETGDYLSVVTVDEWHESGHWYIVGYANFSNRHHWNHVEADATRSGSREPAPGALTPAQAAKLRELCEAKRGTRPASTFAVGSEIDRSKSRALHAELRGKIGALRARPRPAGPVAFFDNTMFGSGKLGLLLDVNGLYSVNGMLGDRTCPSGCLTWDQFRGDKTTLELVGNNNIRICEAPQMGVNLNMVPAGDVRDILVAFRAYLLGK